MSGEPPGPEIRRPLLWVLLLLALFALQGSLAATRDSVTVDEFAHLPVGVYLWQTGDFHIDPINPPLGRMLPALPILASEVQFEPEVGTGHWLLGLRFMFQNPERYQALYVNARRVTLALAVLLGSVVWIWGRALYGTAAALAALLLVAFSPNLLAHAHLVTLDLGATLGWVATLALAWRLRRRLTWSSVAALGAAAAVAVLLKLSNVLIVPTVLLLLLADGESRRRLVAAPLRTSTLAAFGAGVWLFVVAAGYGFTGVLAPLGDARLLADGVLARLVPAVAALPSPLPLPFVEGIDKVLSESSSGEPIFYLAGELTTDGWWYYHLAALWLKTPPAVLFLVAVGAWRRLRGRDRVPGDSFVWVPIAVVLLANTFFNSLDIGVRHLLPAEPLLLLVAGRTLVWLWTAAGDAPSHLAALARPVALVLAGSVVVGCLAIAPRYLEYFPAWSGGPADGHRWLVDSNLDWGQDLIRLREWQDETQPEELHLAYFGLVHPSVYGIDAQPLAGPGDRGVLVISPTFLVGRPFYSYSDGKVVWVEAERYAWLRRYEPVERVGSLFVFRLQP